MNLYNLRNCVAAYKHSFEEINFKLHDDVRINGANINREYFDRERVTDKSDKLTATVHLFELVLESLRSHVTPAERVLVYETLQTRSSRQGQPIVISSRIDLSAQDEQFAISKVVDIVERILGVRYVVSHRDDKLSYEYSCAGKEKNLHDIRAILGVGDPVVMHGPGHYLNDSRIEGRNCDYTFHVGGREFPCHKIVLASRSAVFQTMFQSNFSEVQRNESVPNAFSEHSAAQFEAFLKYIYTGTVDFGELSTDDILGLAVLSRELQIMDLFWLCEKRIMLFHVDVEHYVSITSFAQIYELRELQAICKAFAKKNVYQIYQSFRDEQNLDRGEILSFASAVVSIISQDGQYQKLLADEIFERLYATLSQENFQESCKEFDGMNEGPVRDMCFRSLKKFALANKEWLQMEPQSDVKAAYQKALTGL